MKWQNKIESRERNYIRKWKEHKGEKIEKKKWRDNEDIEN